MLIDGKSSGFLSLADLSFRCVSSYLYDLSEGLRGGLSQQSQTESAVQLSDGRGQQEGERGVRRTRRRRVFGDGQELTGAVQHGRQHLKSTRTHLEGREKTQMLQPCMSRRSGTRVTVCRTFGEGSFSIMVRRVRGGGPPIGESGMKEDQYPYRVLFSTPFTTASRQCRAPCRTRP